MKLSKRYFFAASISVFLCVYELFNKICVIFWCVFLFRRTMGLIKLKSSDLKLFEIDRHVLKNFKMIEDMLECIGLDESNIDVIPLKQIDSKILAIILKWAEHQQQQKLHTNQFTELSDQPSEFEQKFIQDYGERQIFEIINAARFLGAEALSDLLIRHIAKKLSSKPTGQVRNFTDIEEKKPKFE